MWASAGCRCPFSCIYMAKIERPNIKLLTSDFSDLRHKTIYDFIGVAGVYALRDYYLSLCEAGDPEADFMSYVGEPSTDVVLPGDKDPFVFVPFSNRSDLMTLAYVLNNRDLALAIQSQLD